MATMTAKTESRITTRPLSHAALDGREIQAFGTLTPYGIALGSAACEASARNLNQVLVPDQLTRLLRAHELLLAETRSMAREAAEAGDDGTNDLLVSQVIRTNVMQVWFVAEHLARSNDVS